MMRRLALPAIVLTAGALFAACGKEDVQTANLPPADEKAATLFYENCSGCHTLSAIGSQGSAIAIKDRERVDGPNFDQRAVTKEQALYAIQNGGYSGAVMPANILTGKEAEEVAAFLAEYAGKEKPPPASPQG